MNLFLGVRRQTTRFKNKSQPFLPTTDYLLNKWNKYYCRSRIVLILYKIYNK